MRGILDLRRRFAGKSRRDLLRRGGWSLLSQAFNSVSTLAVTVLVALQSSTETLGAFGLAFSVYLLALNFGRRVLATPLIISAGRADPAELRQGASGYLVLSIGLGLVLGLTLCVVALPLQALAVADFLVAIGIFLPGLLFQDAVRHVAFVRRTPRTAAVADGTWFAVQLMLYAWLAVDGYGAVSAVYVWGGSAVVAGAVAFVRQRGPARFKDALAYCRLHRRLWLSLMSEYALTVLPNQAVPWLLVSTAGLGSAGAFRGAQTLLGLMNAAFMGLNPLAAVEAAHLAESRPYKLRFLANAWTLGCAGFALIYVGALMAVPASIGVDVLGDSWDVSRSLVVPLALSMLLAQSVTGVLMGLRALRRVRQAALVRLSMAPPVLVLTWLGGLLWGATGAVSGLALANAWGTIVSRVALVKAVEPRPPARSHGRVGVDDA
jgi:hypothetical protein